MSAIPDSTARIVSDTGPFTMIPEWVLDAEITPGAVRLYGVLGRYSDDKGVCWPARKTLAQRLRVSVDTVDRALKELVEIDAVEVFDQYTAAGDRAPNRYLIFRSHPDVRVGGREHAATPLVSDAATGGRVDAAQNESHAEREPAERESLFAEEQISDPPEDQLHHRLCKVCTGPKVTVAVEGLRVLLIGREFFADHVIDEAIGVCELLDIPPRLPRYLLRVLQDRASETGQHIPDLFERFEDAGRTA